MIRSGDVVKILPDDARGGVEFARVEYVGPTLVEVTGGRWFFLCDGQSLDRSQKLRIEQTNEVQPAPQGP